MLTVRVIVKQNFNLEDNKQSATSKLCSKCIVSAKCIKQTNILKRQFLYVLPIFIQSSTQQVIFFNCLMIPNTFLVQFRTFKSTESLIILRQSFGIDEETGTRENWCYIPDLNIKIDRREGPSPQDVSYFILVVWRCSLVRCLYGS